MLHLAGLDHPQGEGLSVLPVCVNYMIVMGVNYILLDGQLVLSYTYISNPVQLLNYYERSNVKVTSIKYYQILK